MHIAMALLFFLSLCSVITGAQMKTPSAAGAPRVHSRSPSSPASDPHGAAAALLQKGDLDGAEQALWRILNQSPDDAEALRLLGEVRLKQEKPT